MGTVGGDGCGCYLCEEISCMRRENGVRGSVGVVV